VEATLDLVLQWESEMAFCYVYDQIGLRLGLLTIVLQP